MPKIRVLIIDDSALIRRLLTAALSTDPEIEVVGTASDPYAAKDKINELAPDVLTLDVEMPRMDGLAFLKILMEKRPIPVVMVSTLTSHGAEVTLEALALGAVDFLEKPTADVIRGMDERLPELLAKIKAAARSRPRAGRTRTTGPKVVPPAPWAPKRHGGKRQPLIALGASTGGTEAIVEVLSQMPTNCPGIVVVQHMPPDYTRTFARRCNDCCAIEVVEGTHNQPIVPGRAYIAPGGFHMRVAQGTSGLVVTIDQDERINRHRPSVDALFDSVASVVGDAAAAAILTGMGSDGAQGLLHLREVGAYTVAQSKDSCVVFGMPREAIALGAVDKVLALSEIAGVLLENAVASD
jgi:two-component system chemotaxis response regulator CheB